MPPGVQRINAPQSAHPTPHIAFIKPLPGPGAAEAEEYLSRVAAIVHPIMAAHHLAVMTLEEHEPNAEFLGRNFNAGEAIQLVLRRRGSGPRQGAASDKPVARDAVQTLTTVAARTGPGSESHPIWLPFRSVVLVMLHELAHCVQMNHSRAFWKVRNTYAEEMRELWAKGYRGEGMWGRGRALGSSLQLEGPTIGLEDDMPAHLCGGVYRRRRRGKKRKRTDDASKLSYAERQQRRIKRKFGEGGTALGDDATARAQLERKGKKAVASASKPRVAQSNRGRELRAQAALARLGQLGQSEPNGADTSIKNEPQRQTQLPFTTPKPEPEIEPVAIKQEEISTEDETEAGSETESDSSAAPPTAATVRDREGHDLVRICPASGGTETEAGEEEAENIKAERRELDDLYSIPLADDSASTAVEQQQGQRQQRQQQQRAPAQQHQTPAADPPIAENSTSRTNGASDAAGAELACPACSLSNSALQACCIACGCVLRPEKVPGHWRCAEPSCQEGMYVNSGDYGVCGVCGVRRGN